MNLQNTKRNQKKRNQAIALSGSRTRAICSPWMEGKYPTAGPTMLVCCCCDWMKDFSTGLFHMHQRPTEAETYTTQTTSATPFEPFDMFRKVWKKFKKRMWSLALHCVQVLWITRLVWPLENNTQICPLIIPRPHARGAIVIIAYWFECVGVSIVYIQFWLCDPCSELRSQLNTASVAA